MKRRLQLFALILAHLALAAGIAQAQGTPVAANSTATFTSSQPAVSMVLFPDGSGSSLANCFGPGGVPTSATITVTLIDAAGAVVANVSERDIRLEHMNSTVGWCPDAFYPPPAHAPNCADGPTDAAGQTTFTMAYHGGGNQFQNCRVWVLEAGGVWQPIPNVLPVSMNSPDINGDLIVNLVDIVLFSQDIMSGGVPYRSDFNWDGVINLSDYPVFAQGIGMTCP